MSKNTSVNDSEIQAQAGGAIQQVFMPSESPSSSRAAQQNPLSNVPSKRLPLSTAEHADIGSVQERPLSFKHLVSEDVLSPTETLTSATMLQSSFLNPSTSLNKAPSEPYVASYRNNSAVSLPALSMPVPQPASTSKGYLGDEQEEHNIRYAQIFA